MTANITRAVDRIAALVDDADTDATRLSAAKALIDQAGKLREVIEFADRLSRLEGPNHDLEDQPATADAA